MLLDKALTQFSSLWPSFGLPLSANKMATTTETKPTLQDGDIVYPVYASRNVWLPRRHAAQHHGPRGPARD